MRDPGPIGTTKAKGLKLATAKLLALVILVLAGMVVGWIAGASFGSNPPPPPEYSPVELYCLAIADTGAQAGALPNRRAYFDFVDTCMSKLLLEGTVWDFPMEYGAEYVRSVYENRQTGGGPPPLPR